MGFVHSVLRILLLAAPVLAVAQEPTKGASETEDASGSAWVLDEPMYWRIGTTDTEIVVQRGFVHDKASIPRSLWALLPPFGPYTRPAVIHDYLYWTRRCTRLQADNLLMIAMKENGVGAFKRFLIYRGVRMGGRSAWNKNETARKDGYVRFIDPADFDGIETWPQIRSRLRQAGGPSLEPVESDKRYCEFGNSKDVPTKEFPMTKSVES